MKLSGNTVFLFIICVVLNMFIVTGRLHIICEDKRIFLAVSACILIINIYMAVKLFREVFFWKFVTKEEKEQKEVIYVKINSQFIFIVVSSLVGMIATPFVLRWFFNLNVYVFSGCMFISVLSWLRFLFKAFSNEFHDVAKEVVKNNKKVKFIF